MVHIRRLVIFLLGVWIGGSILADLSTLRNFENVDDFLQAPGSVATSVRMNQVGRDQSRLLLRRYVGEANADYLFIWERASGALGLAVFLLLLFGDTPSRFNLGLVITMVAIVMAQHFITPQIVDLSRRMDDLPSDTGLRSTFGALHGTYSSLEIAKAALGLFLGWRLARRRTAVSPTSQLQTQNG